VFDIVIQSGGKVHGS